VTVKRGSVEEPSPPNLTSTTPASSRQPRSQRTQCQRQLVNHLAPGFVSQTGQDMPRLGVLPATFPTMNVGRTITTTGT